MTHTVPRTYEPRPDTRTTNVRLGIWLFLASEAMFFGSLFSAYVLLRTGARSWVPPTWLDAPTLAVLTALLLVTSVVSTRGNALPTLAGGAFLGLKAYELSRMLHDGLHPAANLTIACWFVLTALHWLHVLGGVLARLWVMRGAARLPAPHTAERLHALRLYWTFVDVIWVAILIAFFI